MHEKQKTNKQTNNEWALNQELEVPGFSLGLMDDLEKDGSRLFLY